MKNPRVKQSIRTLAERQNAIRRRKPSPAEIEELNQIFEKIDKVQDQADKSRSEKEQDKKIARPPEANT